jgi:PAS domain S-box-containing protein
MGEGWLFEYYGHFMSTAWRARRKSGIISTEHKNVSSIEFANKSVPLFSMMSARKTENRMSGLRYVTRWRCSSFLTARTRSAHVILFSLGMLLCWSFGPGAATPVDAQGTTGKTVIVLSGGRGRTSINQMEAALRSQVPWPVNFSIVDLDNPRFEDDSYRESLAEGLRAAYDEKPDMVVALGDPSLRFAIEYREKMFPGIPIVSMSVSSLLADQQKWPGVTGVAVVPGIRDTINLALRLHPHTKTVAVITGKSATEKDYLAAVQSELLHHRDQVKEVDIVGPPSGQMLERVATLPTDSVVLFHLFPHDSEQPAVNAYDILADVAQRFPTYSVFPSLALDRGGIGGAYSDATRDAVLAGQIGARVLLGEPPDSIPIVHLADFETRVDWRQLQRWHIPEPALPPGSVVLFRQPSLWQSYKYYLIAGLSLIAIEAALILALIWQRKRRRRIEDELALTNDRLRLAVESGKSVGWDFDVERGRNQWFGDLQTVFGMSGDGFDAAVGDFSERVHPADRAAVENAISNARHTGEPYAAEFRVNRSDGEVRWISAKGKFYFASSGEPERMLGIGTDVTERKSAEEALKGLSGRLIQAQEAERSRIAREIHDDYQQRLAMLSIDLEGLGQYLEQDSEGSDRLRELWDRAGQLGADLHSLSHRLHSSTLDNLGLVAALRSLCTEFSDYHSIDVNFVEENVPRNIPREVALCLFRVTQEALQNVKKHSFADSAEVRVEGFGQKIHLSISDRGAGFDQGAASRQSGIGIRSMEERVRLVGGQFAVHSRPMEGAEIDVWVPIG